MINMIPRFYDATKGEVLVDGVNVKDIHRRHLEIRLDMFHRRLFYLQEALKATLPMEIMVQKALLMMLLSRQLRLRRQRNLLIRQMAA